MPTTRTAAAVLATILAVALAACGDDAIPMADDHEHMDHETEFAFGEPADAGDADRVIELAVTDQIAFDPRVFTVAVGETVTFRITNSGQIAHDFTLGDLAAQEEHEAMMAEMGTTPMMHTDPNAILLPPGETHELTWRFTTPGTVLVGCHQPGHWNVGMRATITVG